MGQRRTCAAQDVHRTFSQVAILENGRIRDAGRLQLERENTLKFAVQLNVEDEIVLEATVNTKAIVRLLYTLFRPCCHIKPTALSCRRLCLSQDRQHRCKCSGEASRQLLSA